MKLKWKVPLGALFHVRVHRASRRGPDPVPYTPDLAASYQHAIVEALCARTERALEQTGLDRLAVGGGVAANGPLRERLAAIGARVQIPDRLLCTDNAAMIASAARYVEPLAFPEYLNLDVYATGERPDVVAA